MNKKEYMSELCKINSEMMKLKLEKNVYLMNMFQIRILVKNLK